MAVACAIVDAGLANDVCATETAEAEAAKVRGQLGSGRDETTMNCPKCDVEMVFAVEGTDIVAFCPKCEPFRKSNFVWSE